MDVKPLVNTTQLNQPDISHLTHGHDSIQPTTTSIPSKNSSQSSNPSHINNQKPVQKPNPSRHTNSPHEIKPPRDTNMPTSTSESHNTNPPSNAKSLSNTNPSRNTNSSRNTNPTNKSKLPPDTKPTPNTNPPTNTNSSRKTNSTPNTNTKSNAPVPAQQHSSSQPHFPPDSFVGDHVFRHVTHYLDIKIDHSNCPGDDSCRFYIGVISHVNACTITFHGFVKPDCSEDLSLNIFSGYALNNLPAYNVILTTISNDLSYARFGILYDILSETHPNSHNFVIVFRMFNLLLCSSSLFFNFYCSELRNTNIL